MSKEEKEINKNDLNDIEKIIWANAYSETYNKSVQMLVMQAIEEAKRNLSLLSNTGHKMMPKIDTYDLIQKNYKMLCSESKKYADSVIFYYKESKND